MNALLEKVKNKIEARKRQLLKKFGDDETLKKWWMKTLGWPESSPLEPSEQSEPQTTQSEENRTFREDVREFARHMRYLNGQLTPSDRNVKIYDYAIKEAGEIFSKHYFIISKEWTRKYRII